LKRVFCILILLSSSPGFGQTVYDRIIGWYPGATIGAFTPGECVLALDTEKLEMAACPGGGAQDLFETMDAPSGTDPIADSPTDTLQFLQSTCLTITGDSVADSLTWAVDFVCTPTWTGLHTFTGNIHVDNASDAEVRIDRGTTSDYGQVRYETAGVVDWTSGYMPGQSDWYLLEDGDQAKEAISVYSNGITFNEDARDRDHRFEGTGELYLLEINAGDDTVAVGDSTPDARFDVTVDDAAEIGIIIDLAGSQTADAFRVENTGGSTLMSIDDLGNVHTPEILDSNGNEMLSFTTTGSAVNEFTITNAAAGSGPELSVTGGDANIDLLLTPKGTGDVVLAGDLQMSANTIFGDTASGGDLTIESTSHATKGQIRAMDELLLRESHADIGLPAVTHSALHWAAADDVVDALGSMYVFWATGTLHQTAAPLFNSHKMLFNDLRYEVEAGTGIPNFSAFANRMTIVADGIAATVGGTIGYADEVIYDVAAGGSIGGTVSHFGMDSYPRVETGVTLPGRTVVRAKDYVGSGTVTTNTGFRIDQLTKGSNNIGIDNASTLVQVPATPAQITSNQNDYAGCDDVSACFLDSDASRNVTGMTAGDGGDGEIKILVNDGANDIVLVDQSGSSSAANRFDNTVAGTNITLSAGEMALCVYRGSRWVCTLLKLAT